MSSTKRVRLPSQVFDCFEITRLTHDTKLSFGETGTGNAIIKGENDAVLRSLLPRFAGQVRCCYIDPPYNNRETYNHYKDSCGHREWLGAITDRIELLSEFLRDDGSMWISIDDSEVHYLKVASDEIFGRKNFVTTIIWQQRTTRENRKVFSNNHEYILVYAKNAKRFSKTRNSLELTPEVKARYKNPDDDPRGAWQSVTLNAQGGHATPAQYYKLISPNGKEHFPPPGRCWIYGLERMRREIDEGNVWFGRDGNGVPRLKKFLADVRTGLTPETLWSAKDVGTNDSAKKHVLQLFPEDVFDTPKPESLLRRIVEIASNPGDLILDAYLGSGTTAAVAHKCDRRYLGIEEGQHAVTHCVKRMKKVIKGEDQGISDEIRWQGGGGFDFFRFK